MNSNDTLPVQIKANRNGFTLVPDPVAPFDDVLACLEQRLNESRDFFQDAEMTLDLRGKSVRTDDLFRLHHLLTTNAHIRLMEVKLEEDLSLLMDRPANRPVLSPKIQTPPPSNDSALLVRNTCRSGSRIVSQSDCVILGDVNPGAEVIAVGDIIVFGNLRGVAHAGAAGDRSARIWALSIEPSQIRIADIVAVPPRGNKPTPKRFEIAEVREDRIEVVTI